MRRRTRSRTRSSNNSPTWWTTLSALDFTFTKAGILGGDRLVKIMSPLFGRAETFEHLRLPCRTVATDIEAGRRVCIDSGRLGAAFRASCSVPMLWSPVRRGDQVLVDGAVIDPVPAEVVHKMGADVCIAVNVVPALKRGVTTVLSRLYRLQSFQERRAGRRDYRTAATVDAPQFGATAESGHARDALRKS
jgi:NTE family protein